MLETCSRARVASRVIAQLTRAEKDVALLALADALRANAEPRSSRPTGPTWRPAPRAGSPPGCSIGSGWTPTGCTRSPTRWPTWRRCPTRSVRWCAARRWPTAWRSARCGSRWVSSRWSTRPGPTSPSTPLAWRLKSGNAVVLRGGSAAAQTNRALVSVLRGALDAHGPADGRDRPARGRRPRRGQAPDDGPGLRRRPDPARGRRPDPHRRRRLDGAGHRDRHRQLSRLRRRIGRSGQSRCHCGEFEGPPGQRVQLRRDPARPPRHRRPLPAAGARRARSERR